VTRQRLRPPFAHPAVLVLDAGAGNADRLGPERSRDPAIPLTVAIPRHRPGLSTVATAAGKAVRFFVENGPDGAADIRAQPVRDRVEAVIASE